MSEHYLVRWKQGDGKWITSTVLGGERLTEREARERLAKDIAYFYNDIEIQLVKVIEEVVSSHTGSHERRRA